MLSRRSEGLAPLVVDHLHEQIGRLKVLEKGHIRYEGTAAAFRADETIRHRYLAL